MSVYLSLHDSHVWNLGLAVNKSKRASNDWYQARSNKRARRLEQNILAPTPTGAIFVAVRLMKKLLANVPSGDWVMVDPSDLRRHAIPRYMQRYGFMLISLNEKPVWVLKVP